MRRSSFTRALALVVLVTACGVPRTQDSTVGPSNGKEASFVVQPIGRATGLAPIRGPLPALSPGWAWPFDPAAVGRGLPPLTVFRPVHVMALQATRASAPDPCGSVEVAKNVWIAPICGHLDIGRAARDRLPVSALAPNESAPNAKVPNSVDLRALGLDGEVKHQQSAPVCWSFAFANVMENALRRAGRADVVSPLHLIFHDEWHALKRTSRGRPTTVESSWPFDPIKACKLDQDVGKNRSCEDAYGVRRGTFREDPALLDEAQRMDAAGAYGIAAIQPLRDRPGDPDEIATTLATGRAVYAAFAFNARAWSASSLDSSATLPDWEPDGIGDHAVTLVGYATVGSGRWFLIHNSWGPTWGDGGYGWVSSEMVRARLVDAWTITLADAQGRVVAPSGSLPRPVPVPPVPVPPVPVPPVPSQGSRTTCFLPAKAPVQSITLPVGEAICSGDDGGGPSPGHWLHTCRPWVSAATNCASQTHGKGTCVSAIVGGHSVASCCPIGATRPDSPGCVSADQLHPPRER